MAELSIQNPTILDIAKSQDPNGSTAKIVEILSQQNDILDFATWVECNDGSKHVTTTRTGLPEPTWTKLYQYVQPTKSTKAQTTDGTGTMEIYTSVDKRLLDRAKDPAGFRLSEDKASLEGMNQEFASTALYGNDGVAPAEFSGLSIRYNDITGAASGYNIVDAGGNDDDLTSMWLLNFSPETTHFIYPNGIPAGIKMEDLGIETEVDPAGTGGLMRVARSHYSWSCGLVVRDWRTNGRIANIDLSALSKDPNASGGTGADLLDKMAEVLDLVQNPGGRQVFLCSRRLRSWLRRQARFMVKNSSLALDSIGGKKFVTFDGVPVGIMDAILHTEDRVV